MKTLHRISSGSIQKRHILVVISSLIIFSGHTMKDALIDTIDIYVATDLMRSSKIPDICNISDPLKFELEPLHVRRDILKKALYKWERAISKRLSSSFTISFHASRIFGGIWSDKRNAKFLIFCCITTQTVMSFLSPVLIQNIKGNWKVLMGWNIVSGLIQGPIFPAIFSIFGQWIPDGEKTISVAAVHTAMAIAFVTSKILGTVIINAFGHWSAVFYVFGCFGVLSSLLCFIFCYPSPESHPTITPNEKTFLRERIGPYYDNKDKIIPWTKMAQSVPLLALILNFIGWQWAWHTVITEYRKYLATVLKVNATRHYLHFLVVPNIFLVMTYMLSATVCDILIRREVVDITTMRKIYNNMGSMGTNSFTVAASYAGCHQTLPVLLYSVILSFIALFYTGAVVNILDLAPNYSGTIFGFARTSAFLINFLRPLATEKLISENSLTGWKCVFWFSFGVCAFVNLIYALFCQATPAPWNLPQHLRAKEEIELSTL